MNKESQSESTTFLWWSSGVQTAAREEVQYDPRLCLDIINNTILY